MKESKNLLNSKNNYGNNMNKEERIIYREDPSENIALKIKSYKENIENIIEIINKVGTDEKNNNNNNDNQKPKNNNKKHNKSIYIKEKSNIILILIYKIKIKNILILI